MSEIVKLDPSTISVNRTEFDVTPLIKWQGVDWGDAAIQAYLADQEVGSSPVDYRLPNRTIQIPFNLKNIGGITFSTIRGQLQQKTGLFQREGGIIQRIVNGVPYYADIVDAVLHLGGTTYAAFKNFDIDATLTLTTLPDWYGDEVILDAGSDSSGKFISKLQLSGVDAVIAGHMPGRLRIIASSTGAGADLHGMLWGLRSRYYDSATTAALFYEAEALSAFNGAASISAASASGGSYVGITPASFSLLRTWMGMLSTTIASGSAAMTHKGTYRVWARVQTSGVASNPNPPIGSEAQVRFAWGVGSLSVPIVNDAVQIPGLTSAGTLSWYLVDLGQIRIDPAAIGNNQWFGVVQAYCDGGTSGGAAPFQIGVDCLYFQPLDDSAGRLLYVPPSAATPTISTESFPSTAANDSTNGGTIVWANPSNAAGVANGTYAVATFTTSAQKAQSLKLTNFGFAIPSGAVIRGLGLWVTYSVTAAVGWTFNPVKAGTILSGSFDPSTWDNTHGLTLHMGGPNDLWQNSWTPTDINGSGFGMAVNITSFSSGTFSVESALVDVFYSLGTGFFVATDAVCYGGGGTVEARNDGAFRNAGSGSTVYGRVSRIIGDLPRIPPSGLENRPTELFLRPSRGDFGTGADTSLDPLSIQAKYRPSYLYVG